MLVWHIVRWDLALLQRSHFIAATALAAFFLCALALLAPMKPMPPKLAAMLIFFDPAVVGLSFVGGFLLLERGAGTLSAISVSPLTGPPYVAAKVVVFTLIGTVAGLAVAWAARGGDFNSGLMITALLLSNSICVLIGFIVAAPAQSVNAFLRNLILAVGVIALPLIGYFGLAPGAFEVILKAPPTYAMLVLLQGAAGSAAGGVTGGAANGDIGVSAIILSAGWLVFWIIGCWIAALRIYDRHVLTQS